jgi:hypothetical protein
MSQLLLAMVYVRNTAGNATKAHFFDDHDPIGPWLWDVLEKGQFIEVNAAGKVVLTEKGKAEIPENV